MKLIIQPDAGVVPVVTDIRQARKTLDICVFRFDVDEIERALGAAVQRGVRVRALIAHTNRGGENRSRSFALATRDRKAFETDWADSVPKEEAQAPAHEETAVA